MRIPSLKSVPSLKLAVCGALLASLCASVQGQTPVDKTPVLHLSFDNVSGSTVINDGFGGSAMNGTLTSSANGTATIVSGGKFGNCLSITGTASSDAAVRIANAVVPLTVGNTWTVAMWIKTTTPGGCYAYQGDGGWANANTCFYLVNGGTSGQPTGDYPGGVRYAQGWESGSTAVDDGAWHHLAMTCNGSTKVLYVDGVADAFIADQWSGTGSGGRFYIGGNGTGEGDGQVCLNGLIDEAYVFNKALSQADIQQLYSNNTYPHVPVSVTVNPTSGYRGQFVTITATASPASGTVTNATADLSPFGLASAVSLVESSPNVFTNSFTVPATAPFGAANVRATVIDTEPLVGSGGATFTVVPLPPTNAIVVADLTNTTVYAYTEASFHFGATNDAPSAGTFPMTWAWYKDSTLVSTNPMGPDYTFLATSGDNGAQIYAIARVADTNFSSIAVTSAVVTLTVNSGTPVFTNGLKREFFARATRANVEIGNVGPGIVSLVTNADSAGGLGNNYAERYSGFFIPPTSDNYVFFLACDDDSDLFLSTDENPANKRLIAQEAGWSGQDNWQTAGGGGSVYSQKRSDQWTNNVGETPYASGIPLVAGQKYYIEAVHHQGTGGDSAGITYETMTELTADPSQPLDGSASRMTAASNNIAVITVPGTSIAWSVQPTNTTVYEGTTASLSANAVSDAEMALNYQWFIISSGGSFPGTALTGPVVNGTSVSLPLVPASYNNSQIYCIASTEEGGISSTSAVVTLTVIQSVFEPGWVSEKKWMDVFNIGGAVDGTIGTPTFTCVRPGFEVGLDNPYSGGPGNGHDSTLQQIGYFVAPSNGNYVFFITSHDGGDLFLSTDNTAGNKRLIAQESGWSGNWQWNGVGGGGSVVTQKRSDQYSPDGGATTPYASGIPLVAGHQYYMEVDHTTSLWGNEQCGVTYRIMDQYGTVTAPADGTYPNCTGNVVGMGAIRCSYVNITQQPANATAAPMGYATFSVAGETDSQYPICSPYGYTIVAPTNALIYQWYKGTNAIPGANAATLTLGPLSPSDNGVQVYCKVRALGYADNSLNPIWATSDPATLSVSQQAIFEPGVVMVDWWTNTTSLANVELGSAGPPNFSFVAPKFESPINSAPSLYVNRVSALFMPPADGNYVFFVNSDDDSDLFLNANGPSPEGRTLVAQQISWSGAFQWLAGNAAQKRSDQWSPDGGTTIPGSGGFPMTAGQMYWLEGVHHDTGGGNNFEATYKEISELDPANGTDTKLAGDVIGTYVPRIPWVAFLQQPADQTQLSGGNPVTFTVQGTNPPSIWVGTTGNPFNWLTNPPTLSLQYQWYKNGALIPGATSASYTQPYVLPSDQGAEFVCAMRALGYADGLGNRIYSNSLPAVLTVVTDTVPPNVTYAAAFQNTNQIPPLNVVNVTFSKWMDPATLSNLANYSIAGATITNISIASNHRSVELDLNAMPTLPLTVTVTGVKDLSGNPLSNNSTAINPVNLTFTDIGTPPYYSYLFGITGYDPSYPSIIFVEGNNSYLVSAEGSDIWNANDGFNFGWELKTNDFDVVVRGVSNGHTSQYAKMGLMVREDLTAYSRNWNIVNYPSSADGIMAPDNSGYGANTIACNYRGTAGLTSSNWANLIPPSSTVVSYPNAWVRLKRTGSQLDAYFSSNGLDWQHEASYDTSTNLSGALSNVVYVGICTTAHNNDYSSVTPPPAPIYYNTAEYADYNSSFVPTVRTEVSVTRSGANVIVSWTPSGGHLESSPALGGPGVNWQSVGTSNPATIPIGSGPQFFRVVNP